MDFIEIALDTTTEGLEIVSGLLYQHGLTGLMIEDALDFQEFLKNPNREWDYIEEELVREKAEIHSRITFFVTDNGAGLEQFSAIKSSLKQLKETEKEFDLGSLSLVTKNVKEEDWANNWKKYFKPFSVGKQIIVKPSWEKWEEKTDRTILEIDPGHIFGTGTHETTQLCIELIEKYLHQGDQVLDIGCGSGILSIASILLGAETAEAVDIDPNAVEIAYENAERNKISKNQYQVQAGNILEEEHLDYQYQGKRFDLVEANIVADVIVALSPRIPNYLKQGGYLIASGIITERLEDVYQAMEKNGLNPVETLTKKDWAAVAARLGEEK